MKSVTSYEVHDTHHLPKGVSFIDATYKTLDEAKEHVSLVHNFKGFIIKTTKELIEEYK